MVVPVLAIKRHTGGNVKFHSFITSELGGGEWINSRPGRFNFGKEPQYPLILPVWTFWRENKTLVPTGIQIPDRPARSLVAISRRISRLDGVRMKNINTF